MNARRKSRFPSNGNNLLLNNTHSAESKKDDLSIALQVLHVEYFQVTGPRLSCIFQVIITTCTKFNDITQS